MTDRPHDARAHLSVGPLRRPGHRRAFTLTEGLIASVVLAIAVVGVLTLASTAASQADVVRQDTVALSLARELMELTVAAPFAISAASPSFAAGNTDPFTFDDLTDFDGFTDTVTPSVPVEGRPNVGDGRPFVRAVDVSNSTGFSSSTEIKIVTVTVTPPRGRAVTLTRLTTIADPAREGS